MTFNEIKKASNRSLNDSRLIEIVNSKLLELARISRVRKTTLARYDKTERKSRAVVAGSLPAEAAAGEGAEVAAALRPATTTGLSGGAPRQRRFQRLESCYLHQPAHRHKDLEQQPYNLDLARWKGERFLAWLS